jgi:ABC-type transport system involved in multi-copper enzyme maturation permease subunit
MKVWTLAKSTFGSLMRDRFLIIIGILFVCTVLLMMTPLLGAKAMAKMGNAQQAEAMVMGMVSAIMWFVSGMGSFLAAWCAAHAVASEMKSGTILAVLARPVKRWEFLLGKYVGVMLLMAIYVVMMYGLSWLLAWIGGERIHSTIWVLLVYPMVRYAVYGAMATAMVTVLHPVVTMGITLILAVVAQMAAPTGQAVTSNWKYLKAPAWILLPSTSLLSEERFLTITHASLRQVGFFDHLTTVAYGLDYALVFMLIATWSFRSRSLTRD